MTHTERSVLSTILLSVLPYLIASLLPLPASAQGPATGTPPFGSFSGGPEIINLANLNVHWTIPVIHKPGRGLNFSYDLSYDSSVWFPVTSGGTTTWQQVQNWGWVGQTQAATGYTSATSTTTGTCTVQNTSIPGQFTISNWVYHDAFGISHAISGSAIVNNGNCPAYGGPNSTGFTSTATDGSGFKLVVTGSSSSTTLLETTTARDGTVEAGPYNSPAGSGSGVDRNGNQISVSSSGVFTDTLGTTALTVAGTAPSNTTFTYTAPSGANASYTMKYTSYTVQTNFGCNGITEYGPTSKPLVSEIDLPDWNATTNPNSRYTFTYEQTPGVPANVTGRLASITLPTGGTIYYQYTGGSSGNVTCADGSAPGLFRTTPDTSQAWTYARTAGSGAAYATTVTDPQGNNTFVQFQGLYETQRDVYQGSIAPANLLKTISICYNGNLSNCTTTPVAAPITQRNITDILPGTGNLLCQHIYKYNSVGGLTEQDDYDYGSGAPGSLLKKILITYASLSNITAFRRIVTVCNGTGSSPSCNNTGTVVAQTNYNYDETTPAATSGIAQHTSVTGSRGNLTSINYPVSSLTAHFTYWDTGSLNAAQDVNGATTTYNYSSTNNAYCQMAFPTSITEPVGNMTQSYTWNCTGGTLTQLTDENGKNSSVSYTDPYYWRPASTSDQIGAATNFCYGLLSNSTGTCTLNPTQVESTLNFNSNNSTVDSLMTVDSLGRPQVRQTRQSPSLTTFDSAESDYNALGRPSRSTMPYSAGAGQTTSPTGPSVTTTYDALARPLTVTDAGGRSVTYSYPNNDVLVTVGPAPTGESTKSRQLEYDALGRLTSVCELTAGTTPWPSASCGQNTSATGYLTKYTHDALGNLLTVTQNAQSTSNQQTRSYTLDAMGRLTSEANPENGTTNYTYDSITSGNCVGTYNGDLVKKVDAVGNVTCYTYDLLHRILSQTYTVTSPTVATPGKYFAYDGATINTTPTTTMQNAKTRLAEAYTCVSPCSTKITDLGFSYSARGEIMDVYELTPHSGGYYHLTQTYWPHGAPNQLSGLASLPTITYGGTIGSTVGLDGEGRITQVTASGTGQQNPVTAVNYNLYGTPPQMTVTFGSGDSDVFNYDASTGRMTQYQFKINGQSDTGALTWNANSTLQKLIITDALPNSSDSQTCNYNYDDLARIAQVDCGAGGWGQSFGYVAGQNQGYDPFGNLTKNVLSNHTGNSFQPTYNSATNRFSSIPGTTVSYDSNGNVLGDGSHTYSWDADGNSISIDGIGLTFDAFDRAVEKNVSGTYTEIVYSPTGAKLALMSGQTLQKAFVPLHGRATAVYSSSGLDHYRHSDWLGSVRLTSSTTRAVLSTTAYAPFGETYAQSGTADVSFTGQNQDTVNGDYDFMYREYSTQGRWPSPDPAGLAAVNPMAPQSWNRYAYVRNNPLGFTDPLGLDCMWDTGGIDRAGESEEGSDMNACLNAGGIWFDPSTGCTFDGTTLNCPPPSSVALDPYPQTPGVPGGGNNSGPTQTPAEAATQYCRDNGHILNFKIPFTNIPVTLDATATVGPVKYGSTNDIQTVIPLMPVGPPVGAGVGFTLKAGAPTGPAPQISYGMQNGVSAGFFLNPDGTHQGFVGSFGLGVGPLYSLVLPTNNVCGMVAGKKN
jgi:RHS repeat-associated protein